MAYTVMAGIYSYGLYGLYSYGLYSYVLYGLYSYGLYSYVLYGLDSYGLCSYGLHSYVLYGLYSYGLYSYGPMCLLKEDVALEGRQLRRLASLVVLLLLVLHCSSTYDVDSYGRCSYGTEQRAVCRCSYGLVAEREAGVTFEAGQVDA